MLPNLTKAGLLTEWQSEKLLEGRHKGFFLGKYKLLDHLGTGGMSSVYLAEHVLMQRRVAIKVLPKHRRRTTVLPGPLPSARPRPSAAWTTATSCGPTTSTTTANIHYLVMEYVEGRDLQAIVKRRRPAGLSPRPPTTSARRPKGWPTPIGRA